MLYLDVPVCNSHADKLESKGYATASSGLASGSDGDGPGQPAVFVTEKTQEPMPQVSAATLEMETPPPEQTLDPSVLQAEDLRRAQEQDANVLPLLAWMEESAQKPTWEMVTPHSETVKCYWAQWDSLKLRDGVLYRVWESPAGDQLVWQLVVPKSLHRDIFRQLHASPTGGHLGLRKRLSRVRERFYWARNYQDIQDWCRSCDVCASRKGPARKPKAPMCQYDIPTAMERIALDVLGPLPETENGNKYLLITMDYFTKWPEAYPLPNQEASTVADVLVKEFICRFGVPLEIHSDQGRNFESKLFAEICRLLGMKKTRTTPLHPQSDGMVERFNRTLLAQLSKFVDHNQRDWDRHVPMLLMAYRSAEHDSTKCSPARLMIGRDLRLPIDLLYSRPEEEQHTSQYAEALQERMERVNAFARAHLRMSSNKMKRYYDARITETRYERGEPVWLHNPQRRKGVSPKLQRSWEGPYTVLKRINDLVYRVQLGPRTRPKVVHHNRLWTYHGDNPPHWLSPVTQAEPNSQCPLPISPVTQAEPNPVRPRGTTLPQGANSTTVETAISPRLCAANSPPDELCEEPPGTPQESPRSSQQREEPSQEPRRSSRQRRPPVRYAFQSLVTRDGQFSEGGGVTNSGITNSPF